MCDLEDHAWFFVIDISFQITLSKSPPPSLHGVFNSCIAVLVWLQKYVIFTEHIRICYQVEITGFSIAVRMNTCAHSTRMLTSVCTHGSTHCPCGLWPHIRHTPRWDTPVTRGWFQPQIQTGTSCLAEARISSVLPFN